MPVDVVQVCHIIETLVDIEKPVALHRRTGINQRECLCLPARRYAACTDIIFQCEILAAVQLRARLHADFAPAGIAAQKIHKTIHQKTGSDRQKQYHKHDAPSDILFRELNFLHRLRLPSVWIFYCSSHSFTPLTLSSPLHSHCVLLSQKICLPSSKTAQKKQRRNQKTFDSDTALLFTVCYRTTNINAMIKIRRITASTANPYSAPCLHAL